MAPQHAAGETAHFEMAEPAEPEYDIQPKAAALMNSAPRMSHNKRLGGVSPTSTTALDVPTDSPLYIASHLDDWLQTVCHSGYNGLLVQRPFHGQWEPFRTAVDECSARLDLKSSDFALTAHLQRSDNFTAELEAAVRDLLTTAALPAPLSDKILSDACSMGSVVASMCQSARSFEIQLEVTGEYACTRWHLDTYVGRALTSYTGVVGTEYTRDENVDFWELENYGDNDCIIRDAREVKSVDVGDLLFIKGKQYAGSKPLVHRSPVPRYAADGHIINRLMLKVDALLIDAAQPIERAPPKSGQHEQHEEPEKHRQHEHEHQFHRASLFDHQQSINLFTGDCRVPVAVLTGLTGSGKKALLSHILAASHGKKIAVIENEVTGIRNDDEFADITRNSKYHMDGAMIETLNGCICCSATSVRDLSSVLRYLAHLKTAGEVLLDAIVIETTGMADPALVAKMLLVGCCEKVRSFARFDGIVSLVDAQCIEQHLDEQKADGVVNTSITHVAFADRLLLSKVDLIAASDIERIKKRLRVINQFAPIERCERSMVCIESVLNVDGLDLCANPGFLTPTHTSIADSHIRSVSLSTVREGELDLELLDRWLCELLRTRGKDIYRMRGVFAIAHANERYTFHAVHTAVSGAFEEPCEFNEARESKLLIIGKGLDAEVLAAEFNACLDTELTRHRKKDALRFQLGAKVEMRTGTDGWTQGTIVELMVRDDVCMGPGEVASYKVQLENGKDLCGYAVKDRDDVIRLRRAWPQWSSLVSGVAALFGPTLWACSTHRKPEEAMRS